MVSTDKELNFADSSVKTWNRLFVALYILKILENAPTYGNHIRDEMCHMASAISSDGSPVPYFSWNRRSHFKLQAWKYGS